MGWGVNRYQTHWVWITVACGCFWGAGAVVANATPRPDQEPAKPTEKATAEAARLPNVISFPQLQPIQNALQMLDYDKARQLIAQAMQAEATPKDYLQYLQARSFYMQADYNAAAKAYAELRTKFPQSDWVRKAAFGEALSLARQGDFRAAEKIYREQVEILLADSRREEFTQIYLEFADAYFDPKDQVGQKQEPNYQMALTFYQRALEVTPVSSALLPKIQMRIGQCYEGLQQWQDAIRVYEEFLKKSPKHELAVEVQYRLGESQLKNSQFVLARQTWQDLLADVKPEASPRVAEVAFRLTETYGFPTPETSEALELGLSVLKKAQEQFPDHKLAANSYIIAAQANLALNRQPAAIQVLQNFLDLARYQDKTEERAQANSLLGTAYFQQEEFELAIQAWQQFLRQFPTHPQWAEVQAQIIEAEFLRANKALQKKQYEQARNLWQEFLVKYPLDQRAPYILFMFGKMHQQQDQFEKAIAAWQQLIAKYPNDNYAIQAQVAIGKVYVEELKNIEKGLEAYRKAVEMGSDEARALIAELTAKTMRIRTVRVFRTDEQPTVQLTSRNIEKFQVRIYRVDLEAFFRKVLQPQNIAELDLNLISADKSFTYTVPSYKPYLEQLSQIPIDLPAEGDADQAQRGAVAVTVSSDTQEATTLVLRSDLEILVKSSRDEAFVFAENLRTGEPWQGAKLLFSDGNKVFAEGTTGKDGIFRSGFEELKSGQQLTVFAVDSCHVASNSLRLSGISTASGLSNRGLVYTDRPAYRAGQLVHFRGLIREVVDDTFVVPQAKPFTVQVADARGRVVFEKELKTNEFGTFADNFVLPQNASLGEYRIQALDKDNRSYNGNFVVEEFQLDPVQLKIDLPRSVYYRGEEIKGKIIATYSFGTPVVGKEVRFQFGSGPNITKTTDSKGEVEFTFPTREYRETQTLAVQAVLPEFNVGTAQNVYFSTRGFDLTVSTARSVYLLEENIEATVKALTPEGKPEQTKALLKVFERTVVDGQLGEKEVTQFELTTDEKTGIARQTFQVPNGATYILRAEATDRFDNIISGSKEVVVSGDEDAVRLRILTEQATFNVGDTAKIQVHWREAPALALVTYEGVRVLGYRLVQLQTGANTLEVPMIADLAPNFQLAIAVLIDPPKQEKKEAEAAVAVSQKTEFQRLHNAFLNITVERELKLALSLKSKNRAEGEPDPGDELEVTVTATDPQGNPVVTELSLAMVEASLLRRFGDTVAPLQELFRGNTRDAVMRTVSSITFAYAPNTEPINPQLLAESERKRLQEEEETRQLAYRQTLQRRQSDVASGGQGGGFGGSGDMRGTMLGRRFGRPGEPLEAGLVVELESAAAEPPSPPASAAMPSPGQELLEAKDDFDGSMPAPNQQAQQLKLSESVGLENRRGRKLAASRRGGAQFDKANARELVREKEGYFDNQEEANLSLAGDHFKHHFQSEGKPIQVLNTWMLSEAGQLAGPQLAFQERTFAVALNSALQQGQGQVQVLDTKGNLYCFFAGTNMTATDASKQLRQLGETGARLVTPGQSRETAYWNPTISTDENGKATLTLLLPDRSTTWTMTGRGITKATLAGQVTQDLTVRKELVATLKVPAAFTDGDQAEITASISNNVLDKGVLKLTLTTTVGQKSNSETKQVVVDAKGMTDVRFPVSLQLTEELAQAGGQADVVLALTVEATQTGGDNTWKEVTQETIPLLPYGMPVFTTVSGAAQSDTTAFIESSPKLKVVQPSLQVLVGPSIERSLIDIVLGPVPICQLRNAQISPPLDTITSDLLAALALQSLLREVKEVNVPEAQQLDQRIRQTIGQLVSLQNDEGGWNRVGTGKSEDFASSRATWALAAARRDGYNVPADTLTRAVNYLGQRVNQVSNSDFDTKALLLHALTVAGQDDFALANQLFRNRPSLSNSALLYTALSLALTDRAPMALQLLDLFAERLNNGPGPAAAANETAVGSKIFNIEWHALYALGLQLANVSGQRVSEQVDLLLANRFGQRWYPDSATGPATQALVKWFTKTKFVGDASKLTILLNDKPWTEVEINPSTGSLLLDAPADLLVKGKQRVTFRLTGRGQYTYQVILGGFVPAANLAATTNEWWSNRTIQPAPAEFEGEELPRGFNCVTGTFSTFINPLTQLPVGKRGMVQLNVYRKSNRPADGKLPYLVVVEHLPSGTAVVEGSIQGQFERYELGPNRITFFVGTYPYNSSIKYELRGYLPGQFKTSPTVVYAADQPGDLAVTKPYDLAVLPMGTESKDNYRYSPDELFALGKKLFERKRFEAAAKTLKDLFENWTLRPEPFRDVVTLLLDSALELNVARDIVRYFEIVKEKVPDREIPFEQILKVGKAYEEMGEYERSFLVYRATAESNFEREGNVAGFLQEQGEFLRSLRVFEQLIQQYPPEPYVAEGQFALAQRVFGKAADAAQDPKLRDSGVYRPTLIERAIRMLDLFLAEHTDDPAADRAAFSLVYAHLELEAYEVAIKRAERFAERFQSSRFLDDFWYQIGFSHFALGNHEKAVEMCQKVANYKMVEPQNGRVTESDNKWEAIYILGQIYHSLGKAQQAIAEYRRVAERFIDAKQAIEYFTRQNLKIADVTTFKPGEPVKLTLAHRNLAKCDVIVYDIDLMKFTLLERNLENVTNINLAGIRPKFQTTLDLGSGQDFLDRERDVLLPLQQEGAYLVVCRGDNLYTTGLVLISPLSLEIQEEVESGRVRVTVRNQVKDQYQADVQVKVIGSINNDFVSGETDLRGVFIADGISGTATVIAQNADNHYAFYRGKTPLGDFEYVTEVCLVKRRKDNQRAESLERAKGKAMLKQDLLRNNFEFQNTIWSDNERLLQERYNAPAPAGVEVQKAY